MTDRISASQIKSFRQCARRWAFAYIAGYREESTPQQALGVAVHGLLERAVRDGMPIPGHTEEGRIAQAAIPHLGRGTVEGAFTIDEGDFQFHGYVDWRDGLLVRDYKTTSNFKYALTPEELKVDPQGILYGRYAQLEHDRGGGFAEAVDLEWLYLRTKGSPAARPVRATLPRSELIVSYGNLATEAGQIVQLRRDKVAPLSLPPNPEACYSYGRPCPHRDKCNLSPFGGSKGTVDMTIQAMSKEDLLAQLGAMAQKPMGQAVAAPVAPPPVAPVAPPQPQVIAPAPVAPAPVTPPPQPQAIAPAAAPVAPAPQPVAAPEPQAAPAAVVKRRRGRPSGRRKQDGVPDESPPVAPEPEPPAPPVAAEPETAIGTLYVNCAPQGPVQVASDLFRTAHRLIKDKAELDHYKFAQFGKGPGVWALAIAAVVREACPESLVVDSRTPEGSDALDTLVALSANVVRSF